MCLIEATKNIIDEALETFGEHSFNDQGVFEVIDMEKLKNEFDSHSPEDQANVLDKLYFSDNEFYNQFATDSLDYLLCPDAHNISDAVTHQLKLWNDVKSIKIDWDTQVSRII